MIVIKNAKLRKGLNILLPVVMIPAVVLAGGILWDVLFGSLATLLGALGTRLLRKNRFLAVLPPIAANTVIVPLVLRYAYALPGSIPFFMLTVGVGEVLSCGLLGLLLWRVLDKHKDNLF